WRALSPPALSPRGLFALGDARTSRPFAGSWRDGGPAPPRRTHWIPYVSAGPPAGASLADPRPQYLPDVLLDAFERLRPANVVPLGGPLLAHLIGMLAMAGLSRSLWRSGAAAMALAALGWGLMPELLVPLAFGPDAQLVSFSLLPVILLPVHHACAAEARGALGAALGLALASGVLVLNGHPQVEVMGALLAFAFAVERALHFQRPGRLLWIAGAGI